jgi:hypothetical protein
VERNIGVITASSRGDRGSDELLARIGELLEIWQGFSGFFHDLDRLRALRRS